MTIEKMYEAPNELGPNPVVAIDLLMQDGARIRFKLPSVEQSRVMRAIGRLHSALDIPLDIDIPT